MTVTTRGDLDRDEWSACRDFCFLRLYPVDDLACKHCFRSGKLRPSRIAALLGLAELLWARFPSGLASMPHLNANGAARRMTLVLAIAAALTAVAADSNQGWENLKHITHRRTLRFATQKSGECTEGRLQNVSDQALTVKTRNGPVSIQRADLIRVMDGHSTLNLVYSSRSSWADVKELQKISQSIPEYLRVTTTKGAQYKGKPAQVTDSDITLRDGDHSETIQKSEVKQVVYERPKPESDSAEYNAMERFYFDPELWPYMLKIEPRMDVAVYDASIPESNTRVACQGR